MTTSKTLIINDPIYGTITINNSLIQKLIAHPFFQRLRRIQQMSVAHLTFPGAMHNRLQHSLGAYHLMTLALQQLENKGVPISAEEKQATQIAILLHDIGHGPFSHTLEGTILPQVHHEDVSLGMIELLNQQHDLELTLALKIFQNTYYREFFHQLVSSQLDVDRLDYLMRDSFYSGVAEGIVGYDRIINMLNVYDNKLVVEEKGVYSVERFLSSRRMMYWQVYYHKNVWATEQLIQNILLRANDLHQKTNFVPQQFEALFFFVTHSFNPRQEEHLNLFNRLDDADILALIKFGSTSTDKILSLLCTAYLNRKMYSIKTSYTIDEKIDLEKIKQDIQNKIHISKNELIYFVIEKTITTHIYDCNKKNSIQILNKKQELKDIADINFILIGQSTKATETKYYQGFWKT